MADRHSSILSIEEKVSIKGAHGKEKILVWL